MRSRTKTNDMKRIITTILSAFAMSVVSYAADVEPNLDSFLDPGIMEFDGLATVKVDEVNKKMQVLEVKESGEEIVIEDSYTYDAGGANETTYEVQYIGGQKGMGSTYQSIMGGKDKTVKKVTFGQSVEYIFSKAFYNMSALETIVSNALTPPTLGTDVFSGCSALTKIKVPSGCKAKYEEKWTLPDGVVIEEMSDVTGIEDVEVSRFRLLGNRLVSDEAQNIVVYSITGAVVYSGFSSEVELPNTGLYVIKTDNGVEKVLCK